MCNDEFIPPLNMRKNTTQKDFSIVQFLENEPESYFRKVIDQQNIIAFDGKAVIAFLSFRHNFRDSILFEFVNGGINNYISTICTHKNYRRRGIAHSLYEYIENNLQNELIGDYVTTRTWSTNKGHIDLLLNREYSLVRTIPNDRIFNGVMYDSVYFCKKISK